MNFIFVLVTAGYKGEDVVLEAVMRWVNHSYDSRIDNLTRLLRRVNLASTSAECRRQFLESNSRLLADPG